MKVTSAALIVGIIVLALGVLGLLTGEGRIANGMNIDLMLDLARIALGGFLIYGGVTSSEASRTAFAVFGIAYLGMFVLGLVSSTLFGLTPNGLGWIDQTLHIGGGLAGMFFSAMRETRGRIAV